jgi:hypothetical protein
MARLPMRICPAATGHRPAAAIPDHAGALDEQDGGPVPACMYANGPPDVSRTRGVIMNLLPLPEFGICQSGTVARSTVKDRLCALGSRTEQGISLRHPWADKLRACFIYGREMSRTRMVLCLHRMQ